MKTASFRTKLWLYFVLFAAVILSVLWVLQTVFLQSFYDGMMKRSIRAAAEEIVAASQRSDLYEIIDRLSLENSLLVYVTDEEGNVYYSSDSYKPYFRQMNRMGMMMGRDGTSRMNDMPGYQMGMFRNLPDNYDEFLRTIKNSDSGSVDYGSSEYYICGRTISIPNGNSAVLYVSGTLGAVGATASIIRMQLIWVTLLSLVLAFVIAWLLARRFAKPINQLTEQAKMLSGDHYEDRFQKGFCRELDDLDDSLTQSAAELSEARNYQKELLANVSHDLRTPLTMIRGYTEMLRDISWEDEEQRNADAGIIIKETDRMAALVNEILEYTRLEEKGITPAFTDVDLSILTNDVVDRFEPLFRNEGGTVERNITPECIVHGDPDLLERAVFNLTENAVHHSTRADKRIEVGVRRQGEKILLKVTDHGEGIDPEELPHIWEKYYTSRQRNGKGVSGLGLAIVKQIAELHGADVSVESIRGEGSCFTLIMKSCS